MKVVLDTNIIVSSLMDAFSSSAEVVRLVISGKVQLCHDVRIISEYREVLLRPKFSFDPNQVNDYLAQIEARGIAVTAEPLAKHLPDLNDEVFLEVALTGKVQYLVTGNLKHYPGDKRQGMRVVSPKEFLEIYRKSM